jgi:hypothetical protein
LVGKHLLSLSPHPPLDERTGRVFSLRFPK